MNLSGDAAYDLLTEMETVRRVLGLRTRQLEAAEATIERVRLLIEMAPTPYEGVRVVRVDDLENALDPEHTQSVADGGPQV